MFWCAPFPQHSNEFGMDPIAACHPRAMALGSIYDAE